MTKSPDTDNTRIALINNNIGYMQKDISEINEGVKSLSKQQEFFMTRAEYESSHRQLQDKVDLQGKFIYMGLGAVSVLSFVLKFFVK